MWIAALSLVALGLTDIAPSWPQWRGPMRDGHSPGTSWPSSLDGQVQKIWTTKKLGDSYSSPIVSEGRVLTTSTKDEKWEVVRAFDRQSGEELWCTKWEGSMKVPFFAAKNGSWIRCTPAVDGDRIFVGGMRDVLKCLDVTTGEELWTVDFPDQFETPEPTFGFVSSPLVDEDGVYVQAGASFFKLDKETGDVLWRSLDDGGGMMGSAFSSPSLATIHGESQCLVLTRESMNGLAPDSGEVLWTRPIRSFRGMNILTPIAWNDAVLTAPYGGRTQLLDIETTDESVEVSKLWENRAQGDMTTPVIIDDHAYFYLRSHRFACISLEDGETRWISEPIGDSYWSLVFRDERILALNDSGLLRLIDADPDEYVVIDTLEIAEEATWAHLAVVEDQLYVRSQNHLSRLDWTRESFKVGQ